MKSGLEGRNNTGIHRQRAREDGVSMKSGLEGRNNQGVRGAVPGGLKSQ